MQSRHSDHLEVSENVPVSLRTSYSAVDTPKLHCTAIYDRVLVVPFLPFPFPLQRKSLKTEYADDWVCCDCVDQSSRSLPKSPATSDPLPTNLPSFAFRQASHGNAGKRPETPKISNPL